jgi:transcriptional regulator with XRE-family HTH domain
MPPVKSIHKPEYQTLLQLLRAVRTEAGLTQVTCSRALGRPQSYISDIERGVRRMDILQLQEFCRVCGMSLRDFVSRLEQAPEPDRARRCG